MSIAYFYLALTILLDSLGIALLTKANGMAQPKYLVGGLLLINLGLLTLACTLRHMNVTIANTTFAGVSSVLVAAIGYAYFAERYTPFQYGCLLLMVVGLLGLHLTGISK